MDDIMQTDTSETIVVDDLTVDVLPSGGIAQNYYYNDSESIDTNSFLPHPTKEDISETPNVPEKLEKLVQLPLTRIKSFMKIDPDVNLASQDAVFAVAKAGELFIHMLGKEAYKFTKQNKKKTIQKKDISDCIDACEALSFLEGTLKED